MSNGSFELGAAVFRWLGRALGGPRTVTRAISIATLSVAETLLGLVHEGIATDLRQIKESLKRAQEADTISVEADAAKKVAEAADAVNKSNLLKRRDAIALAEKRRPELENERIAADTTKTNAEAQAIIMDAETRRLEAMARARTDFVDAVSRLKQSGGDFVVDSENLKSILEGHLIEASVSDGIGSGAKFSAEVKRSNAETDTDPS